MGGEPPSVPLRWVKQQPAMRPADSAERLEWALRLTCAWVPLCYARKGYFPP